RSAVSRHETSWSTDPITPPVARKIGESKMGVTEKPMEGKDAGKKETVVPGSSISGFGPNKRIYQCPKCGGRTLVEGELCKICKMTLEHPQEMVRCERCGLMNNRNIKFCRKCGSKLDKDKT
ncbi:MAG TPA: zinc ribbon domain-containing protein, partial [Methanocellaceae archaeon]